MTMIAQAEFELVLKTATRQREERIGRAYEALGHKMTIWGYGWKGRGLTSFARQVGWEVVVFDESADARSAAAQDGFSTVSEVPADGPLVIAATQVQSELARKIGNRCVFYQEAAFLLDMPCLANHTREYVQYVEQNLGKAYEVLENLEPLSAERYMRLLTFRVSCNPLDLQDTNRHVSSMWFDEALVARKSGIKMFVDVGAFDGDTIRAARRYLGIEEAVGVEMSSDLVRIMQEKHDGSYMLRSHNVAAASKKGFIGQSSVGDGMLKIGSESEEIGFPCDTLDNLITGPVNLIKMDIEGAERQALAGAQRIISQYKPHLALAAYHRPEDITEIYQLGKSFGYADVRFLHYSQCFDDSIFYFISEENNPNAR